MSLCMSCTLDMLHNNSSTSKGHMRLLKVLIRGYLVSEPGSEGLSTFGWNDILLKTWPPWGRTWDLLQG